MILITEDTCYDSAHAYSILNAFDQSLVSAAIDNMKEDGSIVDVRGGGQDRRLPGRGLQLSHRYVRKRMFSTIARLTCREC
jgi:hypothetical protein